MRARLIAASSPTVSRDGDGGCAELGDNVELTCRVTYNGSALMPMMARWSRWIPPAWCKYNNTRHLGTTNASALHRSTYRYKVDVLSSVSLYVGIGVNLSK